MDNGSWETDVVNNLNGKVKIKVARTKDLI